MRGGLDPGFCHESAQFEGLDRALVVEPVEHHRNALDEECSEGLEQGHDPVLSALLGRDGRVRAVAQDLPHEPGQDAVRSDLEEHPVARGVHVLDLLGEAYRVEDLALEARAQGSDPVAIGTCRAVRIDRELQFPRSEGLERACEALARGVHQRGVEGAGHGDLDAEEAGLFQGAARRGHAVGRTADDRLARAVQIRDPDALAPLDERTERLLIRTDGEHGARVPCLRRDRHGPAALARETVQGVLVVGTRDAQGHQLAVAVAGRGRGTDLEGLQEAHDSQATHSERRLCDVGRLETLDARSALGLVEGRRREHEAAQWTVEIACQHAIRALERLAHLRELTGQVAQHLGMLGTLPGEEHGQACCRFSAGQVDPCSASHLSLLGRGQDGLELRQSFDQVSHIGGDHRGTHRGGARSPATVEGAGQVREFEGDSSVTGRTDLAREAPHPLRNLGRGLIRKGEELGRPPIAGRDRSRSGGLVLVVLEDDVEVRAPEAEGRDRCAARGIATDPGPQLGAGVERAAVQGPSRLDRLDVQGGRQDPVMEGQGGLHQPGHAGGALGVTDVRLDAADGAALWARATGFQHAVQGRALGPIPQGRPRAVGLEEPHRGGGEARLAVGTSQGAQLALDARCGHAHAPSVRPAGRGADHRVDPVSVTLRVVETLEGHGGQALTDRDAVGRCVEGSRTAARRECSGGREA